MKLIRFLNYDVNEGLVKYWKRYMLLSFFVIILCIIQNKNWEQLLKVYGKGISTLEYGVWQFWGQQPYHYEPGTTVSFQLPFAWILRYLLLGYCVGSYVRDDMEGYGAMLMIKSRQRLLWWFSKVLWCILLNLVFLAVQYGTNMVYAWIAGGDVRFMKHETLLLVEYGNRVAVTDYRNFFLMTLLLPLLVGIVQSLFQMLLTIRFGSIFAMIFISGVLVLSAYYGGRFVVHGYAMDTRFYPESEIIQPLNPEFGVGYLLILTVLFAGIGYWVIRKKDILEQRFQG